MTKEMLAFWAFESLNVLIPKTRGTGFLKVPAGQYNSPKLAALTDAIGYDLFGLDGALEIQTGGRPAVYRDEAVLNHCMRHLEKAYGFTWRLVNATEFWENHPIQQK